MLSGRARKLGVILFTAAAGALLLYLRPEQTLRFESLVARISEFRELAGNRPLQAGALYVGIYVLVSFLGFFPAAITLALLAGAIFGFWWGCLLVSISSSFGASLSFLASRLLFRDYFRRKFGHVLKPVNDGLERDGVYYLFFLRLTPIFPFSLVNIVMGLTTMPLLPFFLVSEVGMLPGTAAFVNAGKELGRIRSANDVLTWRIILALSLLGSLPLVSRKLVSVLRKSL